MLDDAGAAAREDGVLFPRPLHVGGDAKGRVAGDDLQPESTLSQLRARKSARADAQRLQGSGDADLSRQRRQRRVASERELRARTDGTVHARRRPIYRRTTFANRRAPGPAGDTAASPSRRCFDPRFHDDGIKTFLGQTGNFTGDDIVNIIFAQPQCARFFATSLLSSFVYNDPEPQLVDGVARLLRQHDFELAPVMSAILRSNVFYSDRAYRALVKSPVEFVVGTYKTLGLPQMDASVLPALRQMGQELFYPPNVAGWPGGENWLTSDTMIARQNFLKRTVNSQSDRAIVVAARHADAAEDRREHVGRIDLARRRGARLGRSSSTAISAAPARRRWPRSRRRTTTSA